MLYIHVSRCNNEYINEKHILCNGICYTTTDQLTACIQVHQTNYPAAQYPFTSHTFQSEENIQQYE